jgi:hypothetical protein
LAVSNNFVQKRNFSVSRHSYGLSEEKFENDFELKNNKSLKFKDFLLFFDEQSKNKQVERYGERGERWGE